MELTRPKEKLATAIRRHKLLKDKRNGLTRQFLDLVRENKALHEKAGAGIVAANQNFVLAYSGMTDEVLNIALIAPKQKVYLKTETKNAMNVEIPVFKYKARASNPNDIYSYGLAFTSNDLGDTIKSLTDSLPDMPRLAEYGKSCQLTAAEIERTRRRVNMLEHVMIPGTQSDIRYITMKLDENERNFQTRFIKVRDMILEEMHHCSKREVVPMVDEMQQTSS